MMRKPTIDASRVLPILVCSLLVATVAWGVERDEDGEEEEEEFDVAELFFELNDTDGDLGIHALIDGEAWRKMRIRPDDGKRLLDVKVRGSLARQGLTEIFFESAEPTFDELAPEAFFARFPAGEYEVQGVTLDYRLLESDTELTHVIPAPPGNVTINGLDLAPDEEGECEEDELPEISNPVVIEWDAVTTSHPELGVSGAELEVLRYRMVAEFEDEDENVFVTNVDMAHDDATARYRVTLPAEFLVDGTEGKFEILVREQSFNQTAVETCPVEFATD